MSILLLYPQHTKNSLQLVLFVESQKKNPNPRWWWWCCWCWWWWWRRQRLQRRQRWQQNEKNDQDETASTTKQTNSFQYPWQFPTAESNYSIFRSSWSCALPLDIEHPLHSNTINSSTHVPPTVSTLSSRENGIMYLSIHLCNVHLFSELSNFACRHLILLKNIHTLSHRTVANIRTKIRSMFFIHIWLNIFFWIWFLLWHRMTMVSSSCNKGWIRCDGMRCDVLLCFGSDNFDEHYEHLTNKLVVYVRSTYWIVHNCTALSRTRASE